MTTASDLKPGDTYRAADGIPHTVADVSTAGVRTYLTHADGEERILFPTARVTVLPERTPDEVDEYVPVVFLDGEEGSDLTDILFDVEGVVAHGITVESAGKVLPTLLEWHTPGGDILGPDDGQAVSDIDRWIILEDRWLIHAHLGLGYVALMEVTKWKAPNGD